MTIQTKRSLSNILSHFNHSLKANNAYRENYYEDCKIKKSYFLRYTRVHRFSVNLSKLENHVDPGIESFLYRMAGNSSKISGQIEEGYTLVHDFTRI